MENIITCIRIRPILQDQTEEIVFDKYPEKSVINLKTQERYEFGKTSTKVIIHKNQNMFLIAELRLRIFIRRSAHL